ncbi:coiled-coil domain-containing protein 77 [Tachyglossus aculeatus]|uniref:coiled-coil domain-containing protein 77 n=1 Tax=Tachyglossus aculeatus TaxID=9261 RepID=UPI0018F4D6E5|nr:coiled-coil domain-containing protein 77 [Tachyglossus aculeatus]
MDFTPTDPPASRRAAASRDSSRGQGSGLRQRGPLSGSPDPSPPLPTVSQRLAVLRPSRELLEHYRKKIADFDEEHEALTARLDKYKATCEEQHKLQWEMRQREEEIAELQKALSDMQVFLFQEREHVLRLYSENDRLKIRELEDRKKIQHLLALVGSDTGDLTYFHKEPPHKVTIPQKPVRAGEPQERKENLVSRTGPAKSAAKPAARGEALQDPRTYQRDSQTLVLQVEALQAQLEEQAKLCKDRIEGFLEDRRIRLEEAQVQHQRDQDKIKALADKLRRTQDLLFESTRDYLRLKSDVRVKEKSWLAEKDHLLREKDQFQEQLQEREEKRGGRQLSPPRPQPARANGDNVKVLQEKLAQEQKLSNMYREQCVALEDDLARIREEGDVGREIFKERSEKMGKRLQLMNQRYEALEKRRCMEVEGFKADIKTLRQKLKDVEKLLFQATLNVGPDQDLAILHEVRQGNRRTHKIQGELKSLKAKIYQLESELRVC